MGCVGHSELFHLFPGSLARPVLRCAVSPAAWSGASVASVRS
jgi:hypothetical protein